MTVLCGSPKSSSTKIISSAICSQQISGKTLRVNKIAMKSFPTDLSFGVDFKLKIPPLMCKVNTNNISGGRN